MTRQLLLSALLACGATLASAQLKKEDLQTKNTQSPGAETSVTIGGNQIWVYYHAPSVRGRHIFGAADSLQPAGSIWRMGADYATVLHTDADLNINGLAVPKGDYALYADLDAGQWKLIVNKKLMAGARHIWGINMDGTTTNDATSELGRAAFTMSKPGAPVETLKISLGATGPKAGKLTVEFENVVATVPFTVQ